MSHRGQVALSLWTGLWDTVLLRQTVPPGHHVLSSDCTAVWVHPLPLLLCPPPAEGCLVLLHLSWFLSCLGDFSDETFMSSFWSWCPFSETWMNTLFRAETSAAVLPLQRLDPEQVSSLSGGPDLAVVTTRTL